MGYGEFSLAFWAAFDYCIVIILMVLLWGEDVKCKLLDNLSSAEPTRQKSFPQMMVSGSISRGMYLIKRSP